MSEHIDYDRLAEKLVVKLESNRTLDKATHDSHHTYIEAQLQVEKDRSDLRKTLKKNVFTWVTLGTLVGLWQLFMYWLENVTKGGPHG